MDIKILLNLLASTLFLHLFCLFFIELLYFLRQFSEVQGDFLLFRADGPLVHFSEVFLVFH